MLDSVDTAKMFIKIFIISSLMLLVILCFSFIIFVFVVSSHYAKLFIFLGTLMYFSFPLLTYATQTLFMVGYYLWRNKIYGINSSKMFKEHISSHIVFISDIDMFLHMNNGRYRRAMDFARLSYYGDCGLLKYNIQHGTFALMVAASGRYRQPLQLFQRYKISTKLVHFDDEKFYFEQKFIARFKDEKSFVYSTNLVAMKSIGEKPHKVLTDLLGQRPQSTFPSADLKLFIEYIKTNSESLKKDM